MTECVLNHESHLLAAFLLRGHQKVVVIVLTVSDAHTAHVIHTGHGHAHAFTSLYAHVIHLYAISFFIMLVYTDVGFEIPDEFVVGYALDYNEYFRDLNVSGALCDDLSTPTHINPLNTHPH